MYIEQWLGLIVLLSAFELCPALEKSDLHQMQLQLQAAGRRWFNLPTSRLIDRWIYLWTYGLMDVVNQYSVSLDADVVDDEGR